MACVACGVRRTAYDYVALASNRLNSTRAHGNGARRAALLIIRILIRISTVSNYVGCAPVYYKPIIARSAIASKLNRRGHRLNGVRRIITIAAISITH